MELNQSFLSGLGCGICVGLSLFAYKKLYRTTKIIRMLPSSGYKLVFIVRTDLNMTKGKIAAQCGHAAVGAYKKAQKADAESLHLWELVGQPKIALKTDSINEIMKIEEEANKMGLVTTLIRDAGKTQTPVNTVTVLGVGPAPTKAVNKLTGHLKLL